MKQGQIALRCPKCSKIGYDQRREGDPVRAMEMVIICPDCDDGDFHEPRFITAAGNEVFDERELSKEA